MENAFLAVTVNSTYCNLHPLLHLSVVKTQVLMTELPDD